VRKRPIQICREGKQVPQQSPRGVPVLDRELDGDLEALPVLGGLDNVVADLLGAQTEGTDLGREGRRRGNLASYRPEDDWRGRVGC